MTLHHYPKYVADAVALMERRTAPARRLQERINALPSVQLMRKAQKRQAEILCRYATFMEPVGGTRTRPRLTQPLKYLKNA